MLWGQLCEAVELPALHSPAHPSSLVAKKQRGSISTMHLKNISNQALDEPTLGTVLDESPPLGLTWHVQIYIASSGVMAYTAWALHEVKGSPNACTKVGYSSPLPPSAITSFRPSNKAQVTTGVRKRVFLVM